MSDLSKRAAAVCPPCLPCEGAGAPVKWFRSTLSAYDRMSTTQQDTNHLFYGSSGTSPLASVNGSATVNVLLRDTLCLSRIGCQVVSRRHQLDVHVLKHTRHYFVSVTRINPPQKAVSRMRSMITIRT